LLLFLGRSFFSLIVFSLSSQYNYSGYKNKSALGRNGHKGTVEMV
jgi:hypothetical protein